MSTRLYEAVSGRVPAGGSLTLFLPVKRSGMSWNVSRTVVSCTGTAQPPPTVDLYRTNISPSTLIDSTYDGSSNTSDTAYELGSGESLIAVFTGAQVGSYCTVTITGMINDGL